MSGANRVLVAEYERKHGRQQLLGESFRDMFNRVMIMVESEKTIYLPDKQAAINERKNAVREMLSV